MPNPPISEWISRALRVFHNGPAAVIIFFVLSGYVLALPFFAGTQPSYPRYVLKRLCRIYVPFAAALCISVLLYTITDRQPVADAADFFNTRWPVSWPGFSVLAAHFLMIGTQADITFDSVMWSLVHEMRISIIFPLLIILCQNTRRALLIAALTDIISIKILVALGQNGPWAADSFWITLLWTLRIVPYFIIGILLSKHSQAIRSVFQRLSQTTRVLLLAVPATTFCIDNGFLSGSRDLLHDIAAAMLIVLALNTPKITSLLNCAGLQWLGRISYSLYLIHFPILLALGHIMLGHVSFGLYALTVIVTSLSAATLMQMFVEAPAAKLGQRIARPKSLQTVIPTTFLASDQDEAKAA
jgi:peptidoglycan/LPS O-acetylase OafA/YrhL